MRKLVALVAVVVLAICGCDLFEDTFANSCAQQGGQVFEKSHIDFGYTMDGRVTWVPSSIRFCKVNGAIVDVE